MMSSREAAADDNSPGCSRRRNPGWISINKASPAGATEEVAACQSFAPPGLYWDMPSTQGFAFGSTLGYYPSALRASEDHQKAAAGSRFGCGSAATRGTDG